jgi:hypothetical protein
MLSSVMLSSPFDCVEPSSTFAASSRIALPSGPSSSLPASPASVLLDRSGSVFAPALASVAVPSCLSAQPTDAINEATARHSGIPRKVMLNAIIKRTSVAQIPALIRVAAPPV